MRKIKIAQIGTSMYSHGLNVFENICKQSELFDVAGYVFPEEEKEKFPNHIQVYEGAKELTLEEVLCDPEIEAVTVETEEIYLTKYALLAAQHGKHIHMEKPGGTSFAEFKAVLDTMKKSGKVFHIGYMYRYNPFVRELMEKIRNGELGEIVSIDAQMSGISSPPAREWLKQFPGGQMFFLGCHLIDLILQIKGIPDDVIPFNRSAGIDNVNTQDFGMAIFSYKNGIASAKVNATEIGGYARRQLVVAGSKGTVELKPLEIAKDGGLFTTKTEYYSADWNDRGATTESAVFDRYDAMMAAFAGMVRRETKNPYSLDYELELYKTILKACGVNYEF